MAEYKSKSRIARVWGSKWGIIRFGAALWLLTVLIQDNPSRLTRLQIAAMPNYDYLSEVNSLRGQGRLGEAKTVIKAGREVLRGSELTALDDVAKQVEAEESSWLRRSKAFGLGAVTGRADSVEAMAGAITADMFIVGDIRDLLIEGTHQIVDGESDKMMLALSASGVALTVFPEIKWMESILKIARKSGRLTARMSAETVRIFRRVNGKKLEEVEKLADDIWEINKRSSPGGLLTLLPHIEETKDLSKIAEFAKKFEDGAFVLHVAGKDGIEIIKTGDRGAIEALRLMVRKDAHGRAWLRGGKFQLLRPHPFLGVLKSIHNGNLQRFVERIVNQFLDPYGWVIIPLVMLWAIAEFWLIYRRLWLRSDDKDGSARLAAA